MSFTKYQDKDRDDLNAGRRLKYHTPDIKKDFENSFKGYHKDAPSHLRKESANLKKKEISSKMYSQHRCGKCNRFGHHHDKCTKGAETAAALDKFRTDNKVAGKQTYPKDQAYQPSKSGGVLIRLNN